MQIEHSKIKVNFLKIVANIKSLEKQNRPRKDKILSFSRNRCVKIPTEDQFQHSLRDCSRCLTSDEPKKVLARYLIKTFTLRKGKGQWDLQRNTLKDLTNLVVKTLGRNFNAAFDVSFFKCAGISKNGAI